MGVARQAAALAAAGLVEELKAEREEKREHELDKRLGDTGFAPKVRLEK